MGRSRVWKNPITTTFKMEKEEFDELEKIRWRDHEDIGEVLLKAAREYTKNHSSGNSAYKITDFQDPNFKAMPAVMSPKDKWSKFIREDMSLEERMELDKIADHIRKEIDAKNWLENRQK